MKIKKYKIRGFFFLFLFVFSFNLNLIALENSIIFKVNNKIITALDLDEEAKYLKALNPKIKSLSESEIYKLSQNSIIKEKIKKIEIEKTFKNPKIPKEILEGFLKNIYLKLNLKDLESFKEYLVLNNINYEVVLTKIETEALWNELILSKFSNKVKIDETRLKNKVLKSINTKNKNYLMSEIFFDVKKNESFDKKYKKINKSIKEEGFETAALRYSISETSKLGGKLDWINENSLNDKIKTILNLKKINEFTEPITLPGGFLILKINEIKISESNNSKKNIDEELKKLIQSSRNNQLNQFSKMYFNKIKENTEINEI